MSMTSQMNTSPTTLEANAAYEDKREELAREAASIIPLFLRAVRPPTEGGLPEDGRSLADVHSYVREHLPEGVYDRFEICDVASPPNAFLFVARAGLRDFERRADLNDPNVQDLCFCLQQLFYPFDEIQEYDNLALARRPFADGNCLRDRRGAFIPFFDVRCSKCSNVSVCVSETVVAQGWSCEWCGSVWASQA